MDTPAYPPPTVRRGAKLVAVLALAATLASGVAASGVLADDYEARVEDGPTLVGSDWTREFVYVEEAPTLVGSGPEREFVYVEEVPVLVGSGPEREFAYGENSEYAELSQFVPKLQEEHSLKGGTVPCAETERALSENALSVTVAASADGPHASRTAF